MEILPVELLTSILSFTDGQSQNLLPSSTSPDTEISTLHSLSLTSKTLHRLTTPILYSACHERGSTRRLPLFLITILKYPTLADHVKTLSGTSFHWSYMVEAEDNPPNWRGRSPNVELWSENDKEIIQRALEEATVTLELARYPRNHRGEVGRTDEGFPKRWLRRIFSSTPYHTSDAIVALLLCYLPHLQSLKVDTYNDDRHGTRGFTFTNRVLSSLANMNRATRFHTIALSWNNSLVQPILLQHLMNSVSMLNIKKFSYSILRPQRTHAPGKRRPSGTVISPGHIINILTKVPVSLENLTLSILHGHGYGSTKALHGDRQLGCFGGSTGFVLDSFGRFEQLKVLRAPAYLVLGDPWLFRGEQRLAPWMRRENYSCRYDESQVATFYRYLPTCIEDLILEDCERVTGVFVKIFLEMLLGKDAIGARKLRLKTIEIRYKYRNSSVSLEENWAADDELGELGEMTGIVVVQRVEDNYRGFPD